MICKAASCEYSGEIEIQLFKTTKKQTRNPAYKENSNLTFVFNPKSEAAQLKMGWVQDSSNPLGGWENWSVSEPELTNSHLRKAQNKLYCGRTPQSLLFCHGEQLEHICAAPATTEGPMHTDQSLPWMHKKVPSCCLALSRAILVLK